MRSQSGLTATELVLAAALFTILISASVRVVAFTDRAAARGHAYRLAAALRALRQEAVARQQDCRLELGADPDRFQGYCAATPLAPAVQVGPEVRLTASPPQSGGLGYTPRGLALQAMSQSVYLAPRSGGTTWVVTLAGETGEVIVSRGP